MERRSRSLPVLFAGALFGHAVALASRQVSRLNLLVVVGRKTPTLVQRFQPLVLVLHPVQVDLGLSEFLFSKAGIRFLQIGGSHAGLRRSAAEPVLVIAHVQLSKDLSGMDGLA